MKHPTSINQWRDASEADRAEMPAHVFLKSGKRYPVKFWRDGKWRYSERMIRAALVRANSQNHHDVTRKASRLLEREIWKEG